MVFIYSNCLYNIIDIKYREKKKYSNKVNCGNKIFYKFVSNVAFSYQVVANRKDELAKDGTIKSKNTDVRFPMAATPMKPKKNASKGYRK